MLKSKKILTVSVMTALSGGASFANTDDSVTKQITVEIEVGPKTLGDKLKISDEKSARPIEKRIASDISKTTSEITSFITWQDSTTEGIVVTVSGEKEDGSYVIKSGESKMPVAFTIDGKNIDDTSGDGKELMLNPGDAKTLTVTYGDGASRYPSGKYSGNFTFSISQSFAS
ncbi:hypothetical protein [Cysteiniphilum halobium]|uniref:hypothetical protein n=1 Tax=Cysteiniphilum halobium TaxID=2219059 RepID=UPI000E64EF76|nr:hypothetical protein [Cysteiniphilum halobium]